MRYLHATLILFGLSLGSVGQSLAAPTDLAASAVETHELRYQIDGHVITTYIHLFRESPYRNPQLLEQIRKAGLDHVTFLDEEAGEHARSPSALSDFEQLQEDVSQIENLPVIKIRQKKGFFKRLTQLWKVSFQRTTRKPVRADFSFGLVSTVSEAVMTTAMVFTSGGIPIESGIALVAASSALAYVNNVWNNGINTFLSGGAKAVQQGAKSLRYWGLSLAYDFVQSQALKWIQVGSEISTWGVQSTILMNTLASGIGDVKLNNNIYKAYGNDPEKLARANYYINSISTTFSSIDLMQSKLMPVLMQIGAYDLRLSAPILIGYYVTANLMLTRHPDRVYQIVDFIHQAIQKAKKGLRTASQSCRSIFKPQDNDDPTQDNDDSEPQDGLATATP
jgi:hypothetical protein